MTDSIDKLIWIPGFLYEKQTKTKEKVCNGLLVHSKIPTWKIRKIYLYFLTIVCMYVCILLYFSGPGMYHRCHFMKNILRYHSYILPISASFLLLRESSSFWHLDVHPNCFLSGLFWGGTYFKVLIAYLRKKATQGHWFYVPPTGIYSLVWIGGA